MKLLPVKLHPLAVGTRAQIEGLSLVIGQSHIFQNGHGRAGSHGRILIHAADALLPFELRHVGDIFVSNFNLSGIQRDAAADQVQHGSFSGTVGTDHRYKLAVLNGKGKVVEQAHFIDGARIVIFMNVV